MRNQPSFGGPCDNYAHRGGCRRARRGAGSSTRDHHYGHCDRARIAGARRRALLPHDGPRQPLWIALEDSAFRQVLARSEAQRSTWPMHTRASANRPTFVYGAYGPGAANVAGALAEPFWSGSPVVALTSTMRRTERFRKEYQELDQPPLFASVTKWGAEALRQDTRRASSARPRDGPSSGDARSRFTLASPNDLFEDRAARLRRAASARASRSDLPLTRPAPTAARRRCRGRRPEGAEPPDDRGRQRHPPVRRADASAGRRRTVRHPGRDEQRAARAASPRPTSSPSAPSAATRASTPTQAMRNADVVLAVGTGLGGMVTDSYKLIDPKDAPHPRQPRSGRRRPQLPSPTSGSWPMRGPSSRRARRGRPAWPATPSAVGRSIRDDAGLRAEPPGATSGREPRRARRQRWRADAARGRPGRPFRDAQIADDAVVVADTGLRRGLGRRPRRGRRVAGRHSSEPTAPSVGPSRPALGAQFAAPDKQVVCITGDGGFGYHIGDIETAIRHRPADRRRSSSTTRRWPSRSTSRTCCTAISSPRSTPSTTSTTAGSRAPSARTASRVTNAAEFARALAVGLERRGPTIIDAVIDREAIAPVTRYDRVRIREL